MSADNRRSRRFDLRRLLAFPLLRSEGWPTSPSPTEGELLYELAGENPGNLLFGRFDEGEVRSMLDRAGILEGMARRSYPDPLLRLDCEDPSDQRVSLYAGDLSRDRLLLEARLSLSRFHPGKAIGPFSEKDTFRMLIVHWLCLSDPERPFTPDRPRLPGQRRPGLGVLSGSLALLREIGRELSLDGVLDVPDHFHTALFYSRAFRFLEPEIEGRFQAIVRDLSGIPLALASEAIKLGCLVDRSTGNPHPWEAAEQVMPVRGPLRRYLSSSGYRDRRNRAFSAFRTVVDWDAYRKKIASKPPRGNSP